MFITYSNLYSIIVKYIRGKVASTVLLFMDDLCDNWPNHCMTFWATSFWLKWSLGPVRLDLVSLWESPNFFFHKRIPKLLKSISYGFRLALLVIRISTKHNYPHFIAKIYYHFILNFKIMWQSILLLLKKNLWFFYCNINTNHTINWFKIERILFLWEMGGIEPDYRYLLKMGQTFCQP